MAQCCFTKKDGSLCSANAQVGKTVCVFHDPEKEDQERVARRAGGLSRSSVVPTDPIRSRPW